MKITKTQVIQTMSKARMVHCKPFQACAVLHLSVGETLEDACRKAGLSQATYERKLAEFMKVFNSMDWSGEYVSSKSLKNKADKK